jgi:CO/xanthine dehydrogenase Mo-binding subunit
VKDTPLRGIGIAGAYQGSGFLYSGHDKVTWAVEATLGREAAPDKQDADKADSFFLEIKTSAVPSSDSFEAILQNLAGKILSIEPEKVKISMGDTSVVPDSGPSSNSRNIAIITKLVERCCLAIKKQRPHDELPFTVRRFYKPVKAKVWGDKICDQNVLSSLSWGASVVEIEIEKAAYIPKIRGLWMCVDGGRILSENGARKSLQTAAIQALGWASREQLAYIDGRIPDESIYNYDIPAPIDGPSVEISFIDSGSATPKGIGELAFSTIPAAYVQAVSQALDHPFEKIPLSAQDIWAAEVSKRRQEQGK